MLIYNLTVKTEWSIQPQWVSWMKEVYAGSAMKSGCFTSYQLVRLLDIDEDEGPTYALQLYTDSREKYVEYISTFQPHQDILALEKWGSRMFSFGTLMEIIQ